MAEPAATPDELLSPDAVAERLELSRFTIMKYMRDGILTPYMMNKRGTPWFLWDQVVADMRAEAARATARRPR